MGICGCCPGTRCKKATGERCGGSWKMAGNCATGLTCEKPLEDPESFGICKSKVQHQKQKSRKYLISV